jgi:CheY-like chemotaxis protein
MNKVLLVEDDSVERRMYEKILSAEGFEVMTVTNGKACHQKAVDGKPDIIILDIMMPEMNGFEALDVLHSDPVTKQIPVLVFSNLSDKHYEDDAIRGGAVRYMNKSQTENKDLIRTIRDIISAYTQKPH